VFVIEGHLTITEVDNGTLIPRAESGDNHADGDATDRTRILIVNEHGGADSPVHPHGDDAGQDAIHRRHAPGRDQEREGEGAMSTMKERPRMRKRLVYYRGRTPCEELAAALKCA